jgi:type 1 fimbriae regulatory protein FimB/type 1 fimbriae regulatory protein FimE
MESIMPIKRPIDQSARAESVTVRYLTDSQVDKLVAAAREHSRYPNRDAAMILLAYHHGLRVAELCAMRWDQIDIKAGTLAVPRVKNGTPGVHPLPAADRAVLRALPREGKLVFTTERDHPMAPAGVRAIMRRLGKLAGLGRVHPHMLRHAAGYKLVNQGTDIRVIQAYLGHRNISNTVRYTEVDVTRFKGLF